jgi:hypothetical protein
MGRIHERPGNLKILTLPFLALGLTACGGAFSGIQSFSALTGSSGISTSTSSAPVSTSTSAAIVAGNGANVAGSGATSVPTSSAVVARLTNGLQGNVSQTSGNFATALRQVASNLPQVTDPTKATGFDQVELLVYAACSDLTSGTTPKMKSVYGVAPGVATISATAQTALVAAGTTMLDQYAAKLASSGPTSSQVNSVLTTLVSQLSTAGDNTTVAFMTVCIAANTAGTTLLGF